MSRLRWPAWGDPVWYHVLLVSLVVSLVARPIAEETPLGDRLLAVLAVVILVACTMAMGRTRIVWVALIPASLLTVGFRGRDEQPHVIGMALAALLMWVVCWRILKRIFTTQDVTWATISGSIAVYLLLAVFWSSLYAIAAWSPGLEPAFHGIPPVSVLAAQADLEHVRAEVDSMLTYFSLVTITTLGYGDISPSHPVTRALCTAQATVGQLYLVVLVARLVSMHAQASRRPPD